MLDSGRDGEWATRGLRGTALTHRTTGALLSSDSGAIHHMRDESLVARFLQ